jgi:hypothetical protein
MPLAVSRAECHAPERIEPLKTTRTWLSPGLIGARSALVSPCGASVESASGVDRVLAREANMQRFLLLTLLALGVVAAAAVPASAAPAGALYAQFQDNDCATHAQCGTGLVEGYGHVTTTLDITGADFDPATGCLINVTAVRDLQLVDDPSSTLTLDLFDGVICANQGSAAFTISSATGAFAGLAVLPGTVRVTLIPGVPRGDSAQYRAAAAT